MTAKKGRAKQKARKVPTRRKASLKVKKQQTRAAQRQSLDSLDAALAGMALAADSRADSMAVDLPEQPQQQQAGGRKKPQQLSSTRGSGLRVGKGTRRSASAVSFSKSGRRGKKGKK